MFVDMDSEMFDKVLKANLETIYAKLDHIHSDVKKTNGRVTKIEDVTIPVLVNDIDELQTWRATSQGHWKATIKIATIIGSGLGGLIGLVVAYYFK